MQRQAGKESCGGGGRNLVGVGVKFFRAKFSHSSSANWDLETENNERMIGAKEKAATNISQRKISI